MFQWNKVPHIKRDLISRKVVATTRIYRLFEATYGRAKCNREIFYAREKKHTKLFLNQMNEFMLSPNKHVKLADTTKINLSYFTESPNNEKIYIFTYIYIYQVKTDTE